MSEAIETFHQTHLCPWGPDERFGALPHRTVVSPPAPRQLGDAAGCAAEIWPRIQGSPRRRLTDSLLHHVLSPEPWNAPFHALLTPRAEPQP